MGESRGQRNGGTLSVVPPNARDATAGFKTVANASIARDVPMLEKGQIYRDTFGDEWEVLSAAQTIRVQIVCGDWIEELTPQEFDDWFSFEGCTPKGFSQ